MTIETKHTTLYSVLFVAACTRCSGPLLLRLPLPLTLVSLSLSLTLGPNNNGELPTSLAWARPTVAEARSILLRKRLPLVRAARLAAYQFGSQTCLRSPYPEIRSGTR